MRVTQTPQLAISPIQKRRHGHTILRRYGGLTKEEARGDKLSSMIGNNTKIRCPLILDNQAQPCISSQSQCSRVFSMLREQKAAQLSIFPCRSPAIWVRVLQNGDFTKRKEEGPSPTTRTKPFFLKVD
jgi:hypothetical protein